MEKKTILIQLDPDAHASVFDRVVAIDSKVNELFSYANVQPDQVRDLVHGAIFTRGPKDLKNTALFIGGGNVEKSEALLVKAVAAMVPEFGLRVSVLFDANGCNTTAAAAVRIAAKTLDLKDKKALILAGTGPVGQRAAMLLAKLGAKVLLSSRTIEKSKSAVVSLGKKMGDSPALSAIQVANDSELKIALEGVELVVSAGAAGVCLLPEKIRKACGNLKMVIDLNAVPPLGIEGTSVMDKGVIRDGVVCYGAIGVGDLKMKIHRAAIEALFTRNDQVMDAPEVYEIALNF
ncbi:MAG: bifunctional NADP-dependent methylenetetrahydromethanopterin dehydrogenase/methylenetetrahydrofolate dehydrogenase [Planctomycetes bacterium]|nr:bifunctional NADP-dependent methylenetetrahydromethanopterin dehydrogenase/methylenetetrahydrofolate dehydrogenase [Planctomycetota bacterium]NBY02546.1 bifunctional NADP-dependent methylenetetrahydromethanopterin dehydrogenase/methylenetetrahydrofolate dehydrogenase [Planctomycetota bacterium]